jgi:phage-related minor tail protein
MASKVMQIAIEMAGSISPTLGKSIDSAAKSLSGFKGKMLVTGAAVGAAVGGIAVATGKALAAGGKYLKDLGGEFDGAVDAIRIGTGATGEALNGLVSDFDEVYKNVPTTMEDASKAIADYNTRLGLTGPALQGISQQAIQVSDMLGEDLGSVIEESSQAFQQWDISAEDMGGAMDYVFKVSQNTGVGFTDLMSKVQQFGPQLQDMGYSFEEATALIGQLDKAGVNTDEVLGAMKKSVGALAKEGISASDGLQMYYEKIQNAGSAAEAAAIANEIFGTRAGSTMAAAIRDGTLSVADLTAELEANGETISGCAEDTYDFAERLQLMKQKMQVALQPLANTVFDGLNAMMPTLESAMEDLTPVITTTVETAMPFVSEFLGGLADTLAIVAPMLANLAAQLLPMLSTLMSTLLPPILSLIQTLLPPVMEIIQVLLPMMASFLTTILPMVTEIVSAILPTLAELAAVLLPMFAEFAQALLPPILSLIQTLLPPLMQIVMAILPPLQSLIQAVLPMISEIAAAIMPAMVQVITSLLPVIEPLLQTALQIVESVIMPLMPPLMQLVNALLPPITSILQALAPILQPILSILQPIASVLATIVGWISKVVEWVASGLGWVVDLFTGKAKVGQAPEGYASGGFTTGLSFAGEDSRYPVEAVISFNPAYRRQNVGYWEQAGRILGVYDSTVPTAAMEQPPSGGILAKAGRLLTLEDFSLSEMAQGNTIIIYDFSGMVYSPQVSGEAAGDGELMAKLKAHAAEFFDWLEDWLETRREGQYAHSIVY